MIAKHTNEWFVNEVQKRYGNEYLVLGTYTRAKDKIQMLHTVCKHEFPVTPDAFLRTKGTRCPKCFGNTRKTTEQFKDEVSQLYGNEYSVIGEYVSAKTNIDMKHNRCGTIFNARPDNILHGKGCPTCYGTKLKSHDKYVAEVLSQVGNEYTVVGTYVKANVKIEMKHTVCGDTFPVTPNSFLSKGSRCPHCKKLLLSKKFIKVHEQFVKEVERWGNGEYVVLGQYEGAHKHLTLRHSTCGKQFPITPTDFLTGGRCPRCRKLERTNTDGFKERVFELVGKEYTVLGEYVNARTPIKMRHSSQSCRYTYEVTPDNFLRGGRCPECYNPSKGQEVIKRLLEQRTDITFRIEYRIPECKDRRTLPFDFAVFIEDELLCLIEFDGRQHDEPSVKYGGATRFKLTQKHDRIKTEYCNRNGIALIRVNHKEFNRIKYIVTAELNKLILTRTTRQMLNAIRNYLQNLELRHDKREEYSEPDSQNLYKGGTDWISWLVQAKDESLFVN